MKPVVRCVIYTRKSSEEGLDQAFNSLDAQREACAAYIKSQKSEGWKPLDGLYDDGGFSGGSMERPALQRLLADITAGKVDVVVVYKIDRLTRSLADFARMVELFDQQRISFVSVTQAFNTTTSMGRLTLNVLLSFAQFEREVTGERIRDKIAASKKKGLWMGGNLPLGYDLPTGSERALVVNEAEAEVVRRIFATYLELASVHSLQRWLEERDIRSKQRTTLSGRVIGGLPFSRGALFHLLRNRTYRGEIVHKGATHPGRHQAIVDTDVFNSVQERLDAQARRHAEQSDRVARAPLVGRIIDAEGLPMSPSFTHRRGKVYRYYVSAPLQQGRRLPNTGTLRRVPGPALEKLITDVIGRHLPGHRDDPLSVPVRVEIHADALHLLMPVGLLAVLRSKLNADESAEPDPADLHLLRLTLPIRMRLRGGRTWIEATDTPREHRDPVLINALRKAHALMSADSLGLPNLDAAPPTPYLRRLVHLAFLAPDLQRDILAGRQPPGLTLERLMRAPIPLRWDEQKRLLDQLR